MKDVESLTSCPKLTKKIMNKMNWYTDANDTDSIDLPHVYDPPVIVPAVRYDQP